MTNSGHMVCKTYIFIFTAVIFYLTKSENRTKQSNTVPILLLCVKVLFLPKTAVFLQKNVDIRKIRRVLVLKAIFSETAHVCVLMYEMSNF